MNIVVLGNVCIDHNSSEKKSYKGAGGPAIFMSLFFRKNKDISFTTISSYGKDFISYKDNLNLYPLKPNIFKSLVYENKIKNNKRSQKCHFYNDNILPKIDSKMIKILKDADVLFITPLIPHFLPEYIKKVLQQTKKDCIKILLPQGYFRKFNKSDNVIFREFEEANKILPLVNFVILSSEDYSNIERLSFEWNKKFGTTFLITQAEKGATIINKNRKVLVSTNPIPLGKIVDSIGAGDIFGASFGYNYYKHKNLVNSVKSANESARKKLLGNNG